MLEEMNLERQFADALKSIARRAEIKAYIEENPPIYQLLKRAAAQYVTGDSMQHGLDAVQKLSSKGYAVSLEYIGENTIDAEECEAAVAEFSALIGSLDQQGMHARVSFDLSHIGLSLNTELAYTSLMKLAEAANQAGIELFISMEESAKTDRILSVYERAVAVFPNIGITLQAHLHRTVEDLLTRLPSQARIRLVKGAYQEPGALSIPRSQVLNDRYLELAQHAIHLGHRVSMATHDEQLIGIIMEREWGAGAEVEFEMLYGIRPDLSSKLRKAGYPVRIYLTYGDEWYLYLCHRIAEYPPNIYRAVVAMVNEEIAVPIYN